MSGIFAQPANNFRITREFPLSAVSANFIIRIHPKSHQQRAINENVKREKEKNKNCCIIHLRSAKSHDIDKIQRTARGGNDFSISFLFSVLYIHYSRINGGASILLSARACVIIIAPKSSKDKVSPRAVTAVYCSYSSLLCYFLPLNLPRDQNHFLASFFLP